MRHVATLTTCLFSCFLMACIVSDGAAPLPTPDPQPDPLPPGPDPSGVIIVSADATWAGDVHMTAETIIEAGVTVRIAPGTVFEAEQNAVLRVHGTLLIDGTPDALIAVNPVAGAGGWGGVVVEAGGSVSFKNATGANAATR